MEENIVLVDIAEGVATVTLNRPHAMNAMTTQTLATLRRILPELAQNDAARVVVVRGAGDRAFCAGHDLKELAIIRSRGPEDGDADNTAGTVELLGTFPKPTIAAVKGYVRGGGNWLAAACDIVVAAEDATFAMFQIKFGDFAMVPMVPIMRRIGRGKVVDMLLSADIIDAREAKAIGLVDRLLPVEGFWQSVRELSLKIASRDPQAVKAGKEALWLLVDADYARQVRTMKQALILHHLQMNHEASSQEVQHHLQTVRGSGSHH